MHNLTKFVAVFVLVLLLAGQAWTQDAGIPDTVRIDCTTLQVGLPMPIEVSIVNDVPIEAFSLGLIGNAVNGTPMQIDSVVFKGRLEDPRILGFRIAVIRDHDIDTATIYCDYTTTGDPLPIGNGPVLDLWVTAAPAEAAVIDSGYYPPSGLFAMKGAGSFFGPAYTTCTLDVVDGPLPPTITMPGDDTRAEAGITLAFDIEANSPEGFPVSITLDDFAPLEGAYVAPTNNPVTSGTNPLTFYWLPTTSEVGLWKASFTACDSAGACASGEQVIQVVEDDTYLVDFGRFSTPGGPAATSIDVGNLDSDLSPELIIVGNGSIGTPLSVVYDWDDTGQPLASTNIDLSMPYPLHGGCLGYLDLDDDLDLAIMKNGPGTDHKVATCLGDGSGDFTFLDSTTIGLMMRDACLVELNGDQYLDYIAAGKYGGVKIWPGTSSSIFGSASTISIPTATTLSVADFDQDKDADLAVGTATSLDIYLNDGAANFTYDHSYSQTYGSTDIEVTNHGSDFNDDGYFDLCLATPGDGIFSSQIIVYLGRGDGTFEQLVVREPIGTVMANVAGDFNFDGDLDIAYLNSSSQYVAILFGDGDGTFTNELRYSSPHASPTRMACFDADVDGDLDLAVSCNGIGLDTRVFYFENQLDPSGILSSPLLIDAEDDALVEVISATGKRLSGIVNGIPSGDHRAYNANGNAMLDHKVCIAAPENDIHTIVVTPQSSTAKAGSFSLAFTLGDDQYVMARNQLMSDDGYTFDVYPSGGCPVTPIPGRVSYRNPTTFRWQGTGDFDFELASDIQFSNILFSTTVGVSACTGPTLDTAVASNPYYWRFKPVGQAEYDVVYPFSVASAECVLRGDIDHNGTQADIADLVYLVAYMFQNGPEPPSEAEADVTGCGELNISDVVYLVTFMFQEGPAPVPCE